MGRIVGDGALFLYIQDVLVRPSLQGGGLGDSIMERLMTWLGRSAPDRAFVGLTLYLFHLAIALDGIPYVSFGIFDLHLHEHMTIPATLHAILTAAGRGIDLIFGYLLAPFLWVTAYFRLKEVEV